MTTAAISAPLVPPRAPWRSLLWIVPPALLWIALIYWQPVIPASGVPTTAHQLMAHGVIAVALWLALERGGLTPGQRLTAWLAVMLPYTLWFAIVWSAAIHGVFRIGAMPPPVPWLPMAIFVPVLAGVPLLLSSKRVGQVLDVMPEAWLVAVQVYRIFGIWAFVGWLHGALPGLFGLPAGVGDLLTGVLAVPAALAVATGTAGGRKAAIAWNVLGLADFAVAVTLGLITTPGRFQLIIPGVPSIGAGAYPDVLTPAFVVPSSILLHTLSLRQLFRRSAR